MNDAQFTQLQQLVTSTSQKNADDFMKLLERMESGFLTVNAKLDRKADKSDTDRIYGYVDMWAKQHETDE